MMGLLDRLAHAWNAFKEIEHPTSKSYVDLGYSTSFRPDRTYFSKGNERSIVTAIYNRISMDCSDVIIRHVRLDENDRYTEVINDGLNDCLTVESNKDQTSRAFLQDVVISLLDEGCVAIVPIDTTIDPAVSSSYDINSMRVGRITQWYPDFVRVEVYNDRNGQKQEVTLPKKDVAIIENPFYAVMNEKNSIAQRLIRKLNILDAIDEQSASGKLDLIIQLPYVVKTDTRRQQAENRRKDIEEQLNNSKYGIAYTDGTEKITQLNRPVENNLLKTIEYLTSMLYSQLSITQEILDGSANEETMMNYYKRTVKPVLDAIVDEINRKFLTRTARSQKHKIMYFNDPFKLVPVSKLADIADKFTRNEIMSSNEVRQIIGMKPVNDERADELRNKNINAAPEQEFATTNGDEDNYELGPDVE